MRFSIRDLFLAMVIAALALGWAVDHSQAAKRETHWRHMAVDFALKLAGVTDKPVEVVAHKWKAELTLG